MGVDRQCTIDVRRLVKAEAINAVIEHLQGDPPAGALRIPKRIVSEARLERDLEDYYGISYLAPVRRPTFADGERYFQVDRHHQHA